MSRAWEVDDDLLWPKALRDAMTGLADSRLAAGGIVTTTGYDESGRLVGLQSIAPIDGNDVAVYVNAVSGTVAWAWRPTPTTCTACARILQEYDDADDEGADTANLARFDVNGEPFCLPCHQQLVAS